MSRSDVKKMIDEVDENKDGRLDYGEVIKLMILETTKILFKRIMIQLFSLFNELQSWKNNTSLFLELDYAKVQNLCVLPVMVVWDICQY